MLDGFDWRGVVGGASDAVVITTAGSAAAPAAIVYVNEAFTALTGYHADDALGRPPSFLQGARTDQRVRARVRAALNRREPVSATVLNYRRTGAGYWVDLRILPVRDCSGVVTHFVAFGRDVTAEMAAERDQRVPGARDGLTGVLNRTGFRDEVARAADAARSGGPEFSVAYLDIDRLGRVNDRFGHAAGDTVLRTVAARLTGTIRGRDAVGRLSGDKFGVLLRGAVDARRCEQIIGRFFAAMAEPIDLSGGADPVLVSASVGVASYPRDGLDAESLIRAADGAMYEAKRLGGGLRFCPEVREVSSASLEAELALAIANDELSFAYQPIVDLPTGRICSAEALARWRLPSGETRPPDVWIPVAEQSGLIVSFGRWAAQRVLADAARWRDRGFGDVAVALNISPQQFVEGGIVEVLRTQLALSDVDPSQLEVELTEPRLALAPERIAGDLATLRALGVSVCLDDFGTGDSSLTRLAQLPMDVLKIDRSFVAGLPEDPTSIAIVDSAIALAHRMGLIVVAEGVETKEQLHFLSQAGCDRVQGYLFSPALPYDQFVEYLAGWDARLAAA